MTWGPVDTLVNFARVNAAALASAATVVEGLLPGGALEGQVWVADNPSRFEGRPRGYRVNLSDGSWDHWTTGRSGDDLVSLAADIASVTVQQAAISLAETLGITPYG